MLCVVPPNVSCTQNKYLSANVAVNSFFLGVSCQATNKRGKETFHTAAKFILATGERPRYLGIPGDKEYCITRWERSGRL